MLVPRSLASRATRTSLAKTSPHSGTTYTYNAADEVTGVVDANGNQKQNHYTSDAHVDTYTDATSQVTTLAYDTSFNLTSISAFA